MRIVSLAGLLTLLTLSGSAIQAGPMVVLSSTAPDLGQVTVGDTVTFEVSLTGLNPGDFLDFLGVDLAFPGSLLGTPLSVDVALTPTGVIPDAGGFFAGAGPGVVTILYDDLVVPSLPVTTNGLVFSFTVQALAAGSGTVSFSPDPSSVGFDSTGDLLPGVVAGSGLDFTIVASNLVPEPGSAVTIATALGLVGVTLALRRSRAK